MYRHLIIGMFLLSPLSMQQTAMERHVVRTHDNGQPYVVVYTVGEFHDRVKEELFYDNGQLDYVGHYKKGVEHGEWIYYWPNGNVKSWEYYEKGREEGEHYDCNEMGQKVHIYHYRKGVLLSEEVLSP